MNRSEYLAGVTELYQGEVLGEALMSKLLENCPPEDKFIMSLLLQVESEAKVRLRPLLYRLGIPLVEDESMRKAGIDFAATLEGRSWSEAAGPLAELSLPYLERYIALHAAAPECDKEDISYMVLHEQSIVDYYKLEAQGRREEGFSDLLALLKYPLEPVAQ